MSNESVTMESVEQFVRKLGHDWRNALNSIDLHLSAVQQSTDAAEREAEIKLAHDLIHHTARQIASVSRRISQPHPQLLPYPLGYFLEDLRARLQILLGKDAERFQWETETGDFGLEVNFEALAGAVAEIFTNALQFNPKEEVFPFQGRQEDGELVLALLEKKSANPFPGKWDHAPLHTSLRTHYGLGLFHVRQVLAAHRGRIAFLYEAASQTLRTEIRLPLTLP